VLFIGYFITQFAGYLIHCALHNPHMGPIFKSHADHHERQYPPNDFLSRKYRRADITNRPILYYLIPGALICGLAFYLLPFYLGLAFGLEILLVASINDWLHTQLHIKGHWLEKYGWFWRLRGFHWQHHVNAKKNIGIFSWFSDKLLGTYQPPPLSPGYEISQQLQRSQHD
jgi:sterol desaturase/sphingolipid hydroxylase (fatty acid hydroxylase superfamily)